jgi:hypothetical protein
VRSKWDLLEQIDRFIMRGLDGNYINAQGDHTAKMQVVYQAEQNRQQVQAQLEGTEALRKLREQVNEAGKRDETKGPRQVTDEHKSDSRDNFKEKDSREEKAEKKNESVEEVKQSGSSIPAHIDIRV